MLEFLLIKRAHVFGVFFFLGGGGGGFELRIL